MEDSRGVLDTDPGAVDAGLVDRASGSGRRAVARTRSRSGAGRNGSLSGEAGGGGGYDRFLPSAIDCADLAGN